MYRRILVPVDGSTTSTLGLAEAQKWRADVIVMGTHGHRGLSRLLLGSDAEGVLREAGVPLLLVRGGEEKRRAAKKRARKSKVQE